MAFLGVAGISVTHWREFLLHTGVNFDYTLAGISVTGWREFRFYAVTKDDMAALDLLIKYGLDLNLTNSLGRPATIQAFDRRKYDQVEHLIRAGIDLSIADKNGWTLAGVLERKIVQQSVDKTTRAYQRLVELKTLIRERGVVFPPPKVKEN